ncbi:GNAT family N-acetyltransferase [Adhaeribacter swui]|uniref:GNAT family N-acetyltransferase n=1 Tax=Adhaeribacter swui TaxID=2086471 RepID=A0A7G7G7K6_9BACT|nr:GNAT family N-acetyltransferase [Adhaeribacter swui]QNF33140.1 GNAT family N-acetyltransferase [Adhaeribacter swui]
MEHLLDNPIWSALQTGNKAIAYGNNEVKWIDRTIGFFAGMEAYSEANFHYLNQQSIAQDAYILFTPQPITIPAGWQTLQARELLQMVYAGEVPAREPENRLVALAEQHVPAMLDLTKRTNPGPFLARTITLGNYMGVFDGNRLIAMAGQRLKPGNYTEISAVCTDPAYTGKGWAKKLVLNQVQHILAEARLPMLHLMRENTTAYKVYEKLGFITRREMMVYFIKSSK